MLGRSLAAFGVVAIALWVFAAFARSFGFAGSSGGGGRLVNLVETTVLSNEAALHVVRIVDRYYVIARGGGHLSLLCPLVGERVEALVRERSSFSNRTGVRFWGWKPEARDGADAVHTE